MPNHGLVLRRIAAGESDTVLAAAGLFDHAPQQALTEDFLGRKGHHLVLAYLDETPVGFATGIEIAHPDKRVEMLLYELGVGRHHRRQGIGRALVTELVTIAEERGCREMWVPTDHKNAAAIATFRATGAHQPESAAIMSWKLSDQIP